MCKTKSILFKNEGNGWLKNYLNTWLILFEFWRVEYKKQYSEMRYWKKYGKLKFIDKIRESGSQKLNFSKRACVFLLVHICVFFKVSFLRILFPYCSFGYSKSMSHDYFHAFIYDVSLILSCYTLQKFEKMSHLYIFQKYIPFLLSLIHIINCMRCCAMCACVRAVSLNNHNAFGFCAVYFHFLKQEFLIFTHGSAWSIPYSTQWIIKYSTQYVWWLWIRFHWTNYICVNSEHL